MFAKLTAELKGQDFGNLSWSALERLLYLTTSILEAIRLTYGTATRLLRVAPDEDLVYQGKEKKTKKHIPY